MKNIYSLRLHERFSFDVFEVVRVPGGWVYTTWESDGGSGALPRTSVFVPYNAEFEREDDQTDNT